MCRDLIRDIIREQMGVTFFDQIVETGDAEYKVLIVEDKTNNDWPKYIINIINAVLDSGKDEYDNPDGSRMYKEFYELLVKIRDLWQKFDDYI